MPCRSVAYGTRKFSQPITNCIRRLYGAMAHAQEQSFSSGFFTILQKASPAAVLKNKSVAIFP
jgi:hypothetical protein